MVKLAGRSVSAGKSSHTDKEALADEKESIDLERRSDPVDQRVRTQGNPHS